jgi:hypothetical protein
MQTNPQEMKVPVTLTALVQRLKRRFARDGQTFHVTRCARTTDLGQWHATDNNWLVWKCDSLDQLIDLAREVGCLKLHELVQEVAS